MVDMRRRQRAQERKEVEQMRKKRAQEELAACTSQLVLDTDSCSSDEESSDESGGPDVGCKGNKICDTNTSKIEATAPKRARINILSPGLTSALDRTKISSRNATFVLSEVASSLGCDVKTLNINQNSIQRARASNITTKSNSLQSEFSALVPLTVHWDGKFLEDLTSREHVDRLPVLISGV